MLVFIYRCFWLAPAKNWSRAGTRVPKTKSRHQFQVILTNAVLSTLAKSALFVQALLNCWSTVRKHLFWYSYLNFKYVGQPGSFVSDAGLQNNNGLSQGNRVTLEVWDQASRTVARMIHIKKDSVLPKGKMWSLDFQGICNIYIYICYICNIYIYPFERFPLGIICTEGCLSKFNDTRVVYIWMHSPPTWSPLIWSTATTGGHGGAEM